MSPPSSSARRGARSVSIAPLAALAPPRTDRRFTTYGLALGPKLSITPRAFRGRTTKAEAMPFCTNCGHENPEGSNFCGQCGSALVPGAARAATPEKVPTGDTTKAMPAMVEERDTDSLTAEDEAAVNALPYGSALLIVQRGANAGSRFLLDTDVVTVGRHQDSDIFLDDISVSRRHATFTRTPEGTVVRDVGSLNGTYVNRDLVEERLLRNGDEVQIGKFRLVYFGSNRAAE
jgi:FHA domain/zinc-ribbon domain